MLSDTYYNNNLEALLVDMTLTVRVALKDYSHETAAIVSITHQKIST